MRSPTGSPTRILVGALALVLLAFAAGPVHAQVVSPLQTGHYVPGIMNVRDMATPPDGL